MNYFVRGIAAEVSPIRNIHDGRTEFYLLVITDEAAIDTATRLPRVLYTSTYSEPMDATEAAFVWTENFARKRGNWTAAAAAA